MREGVVKFNNSDKPEFFKVLIKRVNQHFSQKKLSKQGNWTMVVKTVFMCCVYFIPLILMVTQTVTSVPAVMGMWVIMGLGMSGIGLSVMHDANHGSYSKNPKINRRVGYIINLVGGYHVNWKIQHNVLHHSFTNIEGLDDDISKHNIMRLSPHQKKKSIYKYQLYYAPFFYSLLSIYWFLGKDIEQLFKYNKENLIQEQGLTFRQAAIEITLSKLLYGSLFLVLPLAFASVAWWQTLLGFILMHAICGQILALVFQCAHVLDETDFFEPSPDTSMENSWAVHQMRTTANFARGGRIFSWLIGGLNYQIEHHLFPNICHIHYRDISKIVKQTAQEYDVPYNDHKTFGHALVSHFTMLNKLGVGAI